MKTLLKKVEDKLNISSTTVDANEVQMTLSTKGNFSYSQAYPTAPTAYRVYQVQAHM